jgi:hypothetical protein
MTILLGVAGSFLASYVGVAMGWYEAGQPAGWIASIVGAIVILFIYSLVRSKAHADRTGASRLLRLAHSTDRHLPRTHWHA